MRLLRDEFTASRSSLWRVLLWSTVEALPALLSGTVLAAALDRGFLAGHPATGFELLGVLALAMLLRVGATYAMFPHLATAVEPVRDALVRRVVAGALRDAVDPGAAAPSDPTAAVARVTEQVESVRNLSASLVRNLRQLAVTLVAALVGLAVLAPIALPLVVVPLALATWLFTRLLPELARRRAVLVLADEDIAVRTGKVTAALRDITACGGQDRAALDIGRAVNAQARASRSLARTAALRLPVVVVGGQLPLLTVLAATPWLVSHGRLTAGQVAGVVVYLVQYLEPAVRAITGTVGGWLLELAVVADRLASVTPPAPAAAHTSDAHALPPRGARHLLAVENLAFSYGPHAEPVVENLNLALTSGTHMAIVGPSGIGKSTLATLLSGGVTPAAGRVLLDGVPLSDLPAAVVRREIAVVPQEAYVFSGSLRENVTYLLDEPMDDEALSRAIRLLGCRELVGRMGGLDAQIADPSALSAGERQLIALVRTYVSPARVAILDEATSHLDAAAEALVEVAFAMRRGAFIVIAHRMESARRADQVVLMDGRDVVTAPHEDLLQESPLYASLFAHWTPATA